MAMHDKRLYERDPEAWNAYLAEGNARQARKRVAADVIIRDDQHRLLLVNPTYKPDWDIPGGMAEANEPPVDAAHRELREELGLHIEITRLLCIDWIPPHGPWDDNLVFVFDGGTLTAEAIAHLTLTDDELAGFRFCDFTEAADLLRPYVWQRTTYALDARSANAVQYLHHGSPVA